MHVSVSVFLCVAYSSTLSNIRLTPIYMTFSLRFSDNHWKFCPLLSISLKFLICIDMPANYFMWSRIQFVETSNTTTYHQHTNILEKKRNQTGYKRESSSRKTKQAAIRAKLQDLLITHTKTHSYNIRNAFR